MERVACIGDMKNTYIISVVKPEVKRLLGRPWGRWTTNIKNLSSEIGCEVQDRVGNCEFGNELSGSMKRKGFLDLMSYYQLLQNSV